MVATMQVDICGVERQVWIDWKGCMAESKVARVVHPAFVYP